MSAKCHAPFGKLSSRNRQQFARGHGEKRAEPGQKGPWPVGLQSPVLATWRPSELSMTSTDFGFLKGDTTVTLLKGLMFQEISRGKTTYLRFASIPSGSGRE